MFLSRDPPAFFDCQQNQLQAFRALEFGPLRAVKGQPQMRKVMGVSEIIKSGQRSWNFASQQCTWPCPGGAEESAADGLG